jgi:HJR/Mrr/RecB family endonuclease
MRVVNRQKVLLDTLIELVGIKAGLGLGDGHTIEVLEASYESIEKEGFIVLGGPSAWWRAAADHVVAVRAEELELDFVHIMHGIGALPDARLPMKVIIDYVRAHPQRSPSSWNMDFYEYVSNLDSAMRAGAPPLELRALVDDYDRRNILNRSFPRQRQWNGVIRLASLFESEIAPEDTIEGALFDQRFIDYLSACPDSLDQIHWRQLEYLAGEFFRREGYVVEVTQPRGDAGIDVTARRENQLTGPELVVVQAKRYSGQHLVSIETVKAFWTDVNLTNATKGLIVTTTDLARGAREFCEARCYRLTSANRRAVQRWINTLASGKQLTGE